MVGCVYCVCSSNLNVESCVSSLYICMPLCKYIHPPPQVSEAVTGCQCSSDALAVVAASAPIPAPAAQPNTSISQPAPATQPNTLAPQPAPQPTQPNTPAPQPASTGVDSSSSTLPPSPSPSSPTGVLLFDLVFYSTFSPCSSRAQNLSPLSFHTAPAPPAESDHLSAGAIIGIVAGLVTILLGVATAIKKVPALLQGWGKLWARCTTCC